MRRGPRGGRKLALKLKVRASDLRERLERATKQPTVTLESVQRRLELLIAALYGRTIPIAARVDDVTPTLRGDTIQLPLEMPVRGNEEEVLERYRLFAIEQAERLVRGTAAIAPSDDPLLHDLYLLREATAIDAHIAAAQPGLAGVLRRERAAALEKRPRVGLSKTERAVEGMVRESLAADALTGTHTPDPEASLAWARETADHLRDDTIAYRGMRPAQVWGALPRGDRRPTDWRRELSRPMEKPIAQKYSWGRTEANSAFATGKTKKASEKYSENDAASSETSDDEAGVGSLPSSSGPIAGSRPDLEGLPPAICYDEWDVYAGAYRKRAAGVRVETSDAGDESWAKRALAEHAALVRQIRHQFERLRARRMLLPRQRNGDEIDVAAVVHAMTDRHLGQGGDDRLYMAARPARRGLAIALLVDASGSTKAPVSDGRTIIDLEKIAVLLASEALDALGDRYAAYAFAGKSADNVKVTCIKDFDERSGDLVRRRVGALTPSGFTRLGAAVRHATTLLASQSAGHRLLLLLSDGRPNDMDWYQGDYGIEDSRQAILEARASGVYPFCLTIDANASEYLPRIFGTAGHTILTRAEQLPTALLGVVRGLIRRG